MIIDRSRLSKKYAQAFLNIFESNINSDFIEKTFNLYKFLREHKESEVYLRLSAITNAKKKNVLLKLLHNFELEKSPLVKLIDILLDKNRIYIISDVLKYIVKISNQNNNIVKADFRYSHELRDSLRDSIEKFFEKKLKKKIIYNYILDKSLIAGVKLTTDNYLWQYSISQQLDKLKSLFKE